MKLFVRHILTLLVLCLQFTLVQAQLSTKYKAERQVIGSAGAINVNPINSNYTFDFTVGEAVIGVTNKTTNVPIVFLTQGFQQPLYKTSNNNDALLLGYDSIVPSCADSLEAGRIFVKVKYNGTLINDSCMFKWENTKIVGNTNDTIDFPATATNIVNIHIRYQRINDSVFEKDTFLVVHTSIIEGLCNIHPYNVITPGEIDGKNDFFYIGGIEKYKDNTVTIYNRWGAEVWTIDNYDNKDNVWKGSNGQGQELPDGTYFYVIDLKDVGTKRNWVQLIR